MDKPGFTASSRMLVQLCSRVCRAAVAPCLQAEHGWTEGARGEGRSNTNPPTQTEQRRREGIVCSSCLLQKRQGIMGSDCSEGDFVWMAKGTF